MLNWGGVKIGEGCIFRDPRSTRIDMTRPSLITIGNRVDMNVNFQIWTHDWASHVFKGLYGFILNSSGKVSIGNNVYIAANVTILKNVKIGDNCVIGANSLVSKSIPDNSVAVGNPCKVICSIDEYFEKRKTQCLYEAIEYVNCFIERNGVNPDNSDLKEERIYYQSKNKFQYFETKEKFIDFCKEKGKCQE